MKNKFQGIFRPAHLIPNSIFQYLYFVEDQFHSNDEDVLRNYCRLIEVNIDLMQNQTQTSIARTRFTPSRS